MNKFFSVSLLVVFSLVLVGTANAASTIGTNMSTTGTLTVTPATDSATSVRFQNAATTNYFIADSTNSRIGIGAAPGTIFEVQGTASASYFLTGNSLQVGGYASVAYSRFGTGATGHSLAAVDDVLFTGLVEFDDNAFFDAKVGIGGATNTIFEAQGTASASYFLTGNTIQVGGFASVAYSRFGTNATTYSNDLTTTNDLLISGNLEVDLKSYFDAPGEFQGTASASYFLTGNTIQVGGFASVAYSRFGTSATGHSNYISTTNDLLVSGDFEVRGTVSFGTNASISQNFSMGMGATATSSSTFDSKSTTRGACIIIKDNDGSGYTYLTVSNGTGTFDATSCE